MSSCEKSPDDNIRTFDLTTAEESPTAAAEEIHEITQAQVCTGIAAKGKSPEISSLLTISRAAILDLVQRPQVFLIVRIHADCLADMLQGRHLIAQTVIGKSA